MKRIKAALLWATLLVTSFSANASFTHSLAGPSNLDVGEVGSFNYQMIYSPTDISDLPTLGGWLEYGISSARVMSFYTAYKIVGTTLQEIGGFEFAGLFADTTTDSNGKPATLQTERNFSLPFSFTEAGNYLIAASGFSEERGFRVRTPLCYTDWVNCGSQDALEDGLNLYAPYQDVFHAVHVSAVPEPETFALMVFGLGALGVVTRRRKSRSR